MPSFGERQPKAWRHRPRVGEILETDPADPERRNSATPGENQCMGASLSQQYVSYLC